ncbi:hypothetical protein H0H81_007508 [Sphagnurus paluster]|uniref:Pre-rRNA-processing protein n=1 Tax=Sphagnurus paluster TaxID=117069 RepID=A0A9P7GQE6_9AGAR|nr:hypothetical protein H0H81_007508 [Sphagnurus paluster]
MPKSAKKRKDKAADFSKAKLKLGKGKQLASNAIDTSFKARSIALPSQSIAQEKDGNTPTTKRRLTFNDLITHAKHYSASTRKDALLGLRELLEANWDLVETCLTTLIAACVRLIGDEDASVRKALLAFFAWLLPRIPQGDLMPHSPMLLLFTTSAQTHIFPEIRVDAIRFLDLFLEQIPQAVIAGWNEDNNGHGARILEGYLGILNAGTKFGETDGPLKATSTASVILTPASKLIVLRSLSTFLQVSLTSFGGPSSSKTTFDPANSLHTWYLASSFARHTEYEAFERLLQPCAPTPLRHRIWQEEVDPEDGDDDFLLAAAPITSEPFSLQELTDVSSAIGAVEFETSDNLDASLVAHLARTLHSTLIATFLDCAPAVFSPSGSPSETQVQLVLAVGEIVRSLYGVIMQVPTPARGNNPKTASEELGAILGYMTPYFPFRTSGARDIKTRRVSQVEQAFQDLNLIFCELTSLLVLKTHTDSARPTRRAKLRQGHKSAAAGGTDALAIQTQRVSAYILQLLRGEASAAGQLGRTLAPATYAALLPAIWALLNNGSAHHQEASSAILHATIEHSMKTSSKSGLKRLTLEFVARLVLVCGLDSDFVARALNRTFGRDKGEDEKIEDWVAHLPQVLWELGASNLHATEASIIIQVLLRVLQRQSRMVHTPKTTAAVRSKLVPYFSMKHPARGQVAGPYSKLLGARLRRLALDLVATLGADNELGDAVERAIQGTDEVEYWMQVSAMAGVEQITLNVCR